MIGRLAGIACVCAVSSVAHAGPKQAKQKAPAVDVTEVRDKLVVLASDTGHYIVLEEWNISSDHFYFGDGKQLYRQRSWSGSANGRESFSRSFWAPRVDHQSEINFRDGVWKIKCGDRETVFTPLDDAAEAKFFDKAKFHDVLWPRQAHALARDDRGRYYYVDRLRDERGSKGFRLFIGPKGNLRLTRLINIVADSEGEIFASKKGELRLIMNRGDAPKTLWVRGKKQTPLVTVPLRQNLVLIYAELGVYAGDALGTPCDFY